MYDVGEGGAGERAAHRVKVEAACCGDDTAKGVDCGGESLHLHDRRGKRGE